MVDTPTDEYGLRQQGLGTNTNTWGDDKLNEVLRDIGQIMGATKDIALTADYTLTNTAYVDTADTRNMALRFTGAGTTALTITVPNSGAKYLIINEYGGQLTVKYSASTGVIIPTGRVAWIRCGTTDVASAVPNYQPTSVTLTNAGDLPTYTQVQTLIANAALPATAGTFRVSANDTTAGYASQKIASTASTGIAVVQSISNPGADEDLSIAHSLDFTNLTVTTNIAATDRFAVYDATASAMRYQARSNVVGKYGLILQSAKTSTFVAVAGNIYPVDVSSGTFEVDLPASATVGDVIGFIQGGVFGATYDPNGLKLNGSTAKFFVPQEQTFFISYHSSGRGWV